MQLHLTQGPIILDMHMIFVDVTPQPLSSALDRCSAAHMITRQRSLEMPMRMSVEVMRMVAPRPDSTLDPGTRNLHIQTQMAAAKRGQIRAGPRVVEVRTSTRCPCISARDIVVEHDGRPGEAANRNDQAPVGASQRELLSSCDHPAEILPAQLICYADILPPVLAQ
jgi:hypothetical protein